ncbi:putative quinol monooxygenase [Roseateles sp. BYS96W]|uniref:Quinol monooxygenase n=1 Tax=Pelomonas nitida TaxID=3299027 RepID=A0ABW7GD23_9BURK
MTSVLRKALAALVLTVGASMAHADSVNVCALMRPLPGKSEELRQTLLALVEPTSKEAGHLFYQVYGTKDGGLFLLEAWRSQEDLDRHIQQPAVQEFIRKIPSLVDGSNEAHFGRMVSPKGQPSKHDASAPGVVNICSIKKPRSGKEAELRQALLSLVEPTRREEGLIYYNVFEEADGSIFLTEAWRNREALEEHFRTPYVRAFRDKVDSLAERNEVHFGELLKPRDK